MNAPYRAAVIGCGRIGDAFAENRAALGVYSHAEAYMVCERTQLTAVCDLQGENLRRCADRWNVPGRYTDAHELLKAESPEVISICTPDETHFELTMAAIAAPSTRAILVEKPLAIRCEDARALAARAKDRNVQLAVNYSRRYSGAYGELREQLRAGKWGTLQKISGFYTRGIMHNGTHWLDLARFLGGDVVRVQAFAAADRSSADPTPDVRLEFASGAMGFLHGCEAGNFTIFEMDIVTSTGRVRLVDSGRTMEFFVAAESREVSGYRYLQPDGTRTGVLRDLTLHAVEDLAGCLDESGRVPACSGEDAITALEIAVAIEASSRSGVSMDLRFSS